MSVSTRASKLLSSPSAIMIGHSICANNPYSSNNPQGHLNFGTAENHLMHDKLLPKLNEAISLSDKHIHYNQLNGMEDVREVVALFLENYLNLKKVNANNIVIQTGVSAICESLSFSMFDEDDIILIAAPYYTGFNDDFTKRFGCRFLPVNLNPDNDFLHDISIFIDAYNNCSEKNKIKAVLITHPHNPSGEILREDFMDDLIQMCGDYELELLSDEIYALSNHDSSPHISLYQKAIDQNIKAHLLYGMAKDFSLAGLKVGFYYSEDDDLLDVMRSVSYFHPVSTQTQLLVKNILSDDTFLKEYIPENQRRLRELSLVITTQLSQFKFIPTESGLFMLLDLREHCKSFEQEREIFDTLLNVVKINLTPGQDLGLVEPGFFRVCFAKSKRDVLEFIVRMKKLNF